MDHVRLELDADVEDAFVAGPSSGGSTRGVWVPIEAKLRLLSVRLLYEVCRVQKLSLNDLSAFFYLLLLISRECGILEIFDDTFIEYLFELVEQTRDQQDETFNYAVIKLIVRPFFFYQSAGFTH
jgi:hypothetical protein